MDNFDELALKWDKEPRRTERAKIVADEIVKAIPNLDKMNGLEYGCGTGLLSFNLQPNLKHITLADSSQGMLGVVKQKIENKKTDNMSPMLLDLTTDENTLEQKFDIIYTLMTLHHIADIDKIINSFSKMLNPLGYICVADLDEEDGSFHGNGFEGHYGFNRNKLTEKLIKYGFENISWKIPYEIMKKTDDGIERKYPMFLMIGQKNNGTN